MMGCENSDYSYCGSNFPGPGVTEVLEEPVEEIEVDSREATVGQNVILTKKISHFSEKGNYFYINF